MELNIALLCITVVQQNGRHTKLTRKVPCCNALSGVRIMSRAPEHCVNIIPPTKPSTCLPHRPAPAGQSPTSPGQLRSIAVSPKIPQRATALLRSINLNYNSETDVNITPPQMIQAAGQCPSPAQTDLRLTVTVSQLTSAKKKKKNPQGAPLDATNRGRRRIAAFAPCRSPA